MSQASRILTGLAVLLAVLVLAPREGAAQEIKLKLSHFPPPPHNHHLNVIVPWALALLTVWPQMALVLPRTMVR